MRIELREVSAAHGDRPALRRVSLAVASGERLALLGPSGSGKSTLLAVLAGLHPCQGTVLLDGRDASGLDPRRRGLGMVFQDLALWPHLEVEAHLAFVLGAAGVPRAERGARIREVLAWLELEALGARLPAQLSGGEAQRLALARALVLRPRALLLDEPFGALDRRLRERLQALLREIHARTRATTVLVTHDYDEAFALAERVAVLHAGELLQCDTPQELYRRPRDARVAELSGEVTLLAARRAGEEVCLPWGRARAEFAADVGPDTCLACLRPEDVRVRPGGPGRVRASRFRGGRWLVEVELAGQRLSAYAELALAPQEPVEVQLDEPVWCLREGKD